MHDLRLAVRTLRATPVVSAVAILSLALGIGANTAVFSILDSLVLRSLPVRESGRLVQVFPGSSNSSWTNPLWEQLRDRRQQIFDGAFAKSATQFNLSDKGETEYVEGIWASGSFFDVLGVPAMLGRTFTPADDVRGGGPDGPVAVIGYGFWQKRFGGAADAIGKTLTLERVPFTIIGVTPPEFFGVDVGRTFDVAIPLGVEPLIRGRDSALDRRSWWWLNIIARLKPGQSSEQATAALRGQQPQIRDATLPPNYRPEDLPRYMKEPFTLAPAATGQSGLRRRYQQPLTIIMAVVALVLLIACANIANLLLARATARRHELSVRLALGASRWNLARALLAESLLLSASGAGLGLVFAQWGGRLLVEQLSTQSNRVFLELPLDWRVLAFTAGVAIATTVVFGTAPAFRATRVEPNEALKEHGRTITGDGRFGLGNVLVVAQVALSLILIVGAGLLTRTFSSLQHLHLGFDRDPVLVASVNTMKSAVGPEGRAELFERMRQNIAALPGVAGASISGITPVSGSTWNTSIELPNQKDVPEDQRESYVNAVSPGWFTTYGTKLLAGRDFNAQDRMGAPAVVIVNETFARKYMNGANPVGRTFSQTGRPNHPEPSLEIVGYVADATYESLREPVPPTMYTPLAQWAEPFSTLSISVRAAGGSPALLTRSVASAISGVDRDVRFTFRPLADYVNASLIQERLVATLSGFFGALALLLAGLGLYGVTSYAVSRRRAEIGIRMALGAAPGGVVRLVLSRVSLLVGAGVLVGAGLSLWASRFVATLLYGLQPRDPTTLAGAVVVLSAIGALAGWLPARRASRIDPAEVLRDS